MKKDIKSLMIVQPILADYRIYFFNKLVNKFNTKLYSDLAPSSSGHMVSSECKFETIKTPIVNLFKGRIYYQRGLLKGIFNFKPDNIFITAHPKNVAFWLVLIVAKLTGIRTFVHGQGFYNKPNGSAFLYFTYKLMFALCNRYVCYTESTKESLKVLPSWCLKKCFVADNTIYNKYALSNELKDYDENGIFYVGRIREGSNVELLADAVVSLNERGNNLKLHVIGSGDFEEELKNKYSQNNNIIFYGKVFDQKKITEISKFCFLGCYPGQAGLSIVHYMSLSLPVLVHFDLTQHMGPEPSYVQHQFNGFLFHEYSKTSIEKGILEAFKIRKTTEYTEIGKHAFQTYSKLINPDFADKLISAIEE